MKHIKLFLLTAAILLFPALSIHAGALESDFITSDFRTGVCVTGFHGAAGAVTIPDTLNGQTVCGIASNAFSGSDVTELTIPSTVTWIGMLGTNAVDSPHFTASTALTAIHVSSDNPTFRSADGVLLDKSGATLLDYPCSRRQTAYAIPDGVKTVRDLAFYQASCLQTVSFPDSLTAIGDSAFSGCTALTGADLPFRVKSIAGAAFEDCTAMTEICIPNPACEIALYPATIPANAAISGYDISSAFRYAEKFNRTFRSLGAFSEAVCPHPDSSSAITTQATCSHTGTITQTCTTCGRTLTNPIPIDSSRHSAVPMTDVAATCTKSGQRGGTVCADCGKTLTAPTDIPALGHTSQTKTVKATVKKDGSITKTCTRCGTVLSAVRIPYPKTISLSRMQYTYSGKNKNPSVTVRGSDGKTIAASHYRFTVPKSRSKVGTYTAVVTFQGSRYTGTAKLTFTIRPAASTITSLSARSRGFSARWKKKTTQTSGYQLQYCTKKTFPSSTRKTLTITKNSTTSKTISKLSAKKTYYVRVRTYKTVKSGSKSVRYYSDWSKIRSVRTK